MQRADKKSQTTQCQIDLHGRVTYNETISIEATLFKNRVSNEYISKHCRIIIRQLKTAKDSSVGSIKIDLVDYIDRLPVVENLAFTKCALDDVFISCTISAKEQVEDTSTVYDDNMSTTSANTVRVDSFWFDEEQQQQNNNSEQHPPIHLTNDHLMGLDGGIKQREMASFRIKKFSDIMSDEQPSPHDRMDALEKTLQSKTTELRHYYEEEKKWNKAMISWQREKSNFEASNIEINFKLQQEKEKCKKAKIELSEITLSTKRIILDKQRIEQKYANLLKSLSNDKNALLAQISAQQIEYDDLEQQLLQQQLSWKETGNILQNELEKQKRTTVKAMNEIKKYKRYKSENAEMQKTIKRLKSEMNGMKEEHRIQIETLKAVQIESNKQKEKEKEVEIEDEKVENTETVTSLQSNNAKSVQIEDMNYGTNLKSQNDAAKTEEKVPKKKKKKRRNSKVAQLANSFVSDHNGENGKKPSKIKKKRKKRIKAKSVNPKKPSPTV